MAYLWRRVSAWMKTHPVITDVIITALLFALVVSSFIFPSNPNDDVRAVDWFAWVLAVVGTLPVVVRRRYPGRALLICTFSTAVYWVLDYADTAVGVPLLVLAYSAAAYVGSNKDARRVGIMFAAVVFLVITAGVLYDGEDITAIEAIANFVLYGAAWIIGDNVRTHRNHMNEMKERALVAEAQRETEAARAIEQERTAIARELHDVVAHGLSVMVVQASAARRVLQTGNGSAKELAAAEKALGAVEDTGRSSLDEMRRLLGVLRPEDSDGTALAPLPGLDDLEQLVDQVKSAGLPVRLRIEGTSRALPAGIELSAYRIVQESLTNAIKHAGPAIADVTLDYQSDALGVKIADDGRGNATRSFNHDSGQGLRGMRERVESIGGTFSAGPKTGGGYCVSAMLPVRSS